jgi:predicted metal-binding membrane protein
VWIESQRSHDARDKEMRMQPVDVTHIWMAGVMLVMASFGLIAVIGYLRAKK